MAACVAASIEAASIKRTATNIEDAKLHNAFGEDILQAYLMAAVEIAAGEDDFPASVLHHGGVNLNTAASSLSKRDTDVPREQEVVSVEAMPKFLYHRQEIVLSRSSAHYTGGVEEGSEFADSDIQKVTVAVIEANFVNETSTEDSKSSDENCVNHLEGTAAIPSNRERARGSNDAGEADSASPVVLDCAASKRDTGTCMSPDVIASQGVDGAKNSSWNSSNLHEPSNELDVIQTLGRPNDDDHEELSEIGKGPAVNLKREATASTLQDSGATDSVNEILVDERDVQSRTSVVNSSKTESKVDVSSTRTTKIDAVSNAENATTMSRSFSFTGLNHVAFCVDNLERSLDFYCTLLGLKTSVDRPELPYRGAWLFVGAEGIHIMEVPNPDPVNGRPAHGGFDRHACLNCKNVEAVRLELEKAGIPYQPSPVPSLFTRDPDGNGLEFIEVNS